MKWLSLALKNLVRRPVRSGLTMLGVAIAVAVLFVLVQFQRGYEQGLREEIDGLGAHIMVVPRGCPYEAATIVLHGGKWPRYMDERWYRLIANTPGVALAASVIMDAIIKGGGAENLIYIGIDERYPRLRAQWRYAAGGWFEEDHGVILGASAARKEGVQAGERITVEDEGRVGPVRLRVAGILERTNTQDDGFYFLPKGTLQRLFDLEGKIVVVLVRVADVARVEEVARELRSRAQAAEAGMNVFPLSELLSTLRALLANTRVFALAIVTVALLIGGVGVLNTILMTVHERVHEIGMLKAVGASARDVFRLIWLETLIVCLLGGVVGVGIALASGHGVVMLLGRVLPHAPAAFALGFAWDTVGLCLAVAAVLGLAAGTFPAWKASAVSPIEAIRGGGR